MHLELRSCDSGQGTSSGGRQEVHRPHPDFSVGPAKQEVSSLAGQRLPTRMLGGMHCGFRLPDLPVVDRAVPAPFEWRFTDVGEGGSVALGKKFAEEVDSWAASALEAGGVFERARSGGAATGVSRLHDADAELLDASSKVEGEDDRPGPESLETMCFDPTMGLELDIFSGQIVDVNDSLSSLDISKDATGLVACDPSETGSTEPEPSYSQLTDLEDLVNPSQASLPEEEFMLPLQQGSPPSSPATPVNPRGSLPASHGPASSRPSCQRRFQCP
jgi:hypothetical protein